MPTGTETRERTWAGYLLGFALGGFFDGILLHQILQWHHLLSGVQAEALRDLRTQVLADGLFHVLMYVIALAGLWALWRARQFTQLSGRRLIAEALIGFGIWHVLDAVLSHWILGIHRIRMDSPNPLAWDVAWLVAFGLVPLVWGFVARKRDIGGPPSRPVTSMLSLAVLLLAPIAALPPSNTQQFAVLVAPSRASALLDGLAEVGAGITWADPTGALWVIQLSDGAEPARLYEHGALVITSSSVVLGCLAWTRIKQD